MARKMYLEKEVKKRVEKRKKKNKSERKKFSVLKFRQTCISKCAKNAFFSGGPEIVF
jgi:hypothetical protein